MKRNSVKMPCRKEKNLLSQARSVLFSCWRKLETPLLRNEKRKRYFPVLHPNESSAPRKKEKKMNKKRERKNSNRKKQDEN